MAECKDKYGNCTLVREDDLPVQCVGEWAKEKHDFIRRYIEASGGPRKKYAARVETLMIDRMDQNQEIVNRYPHVETIW